MSLLFRLLGAALLVVLFGWGIFGSAGDSASIFINLPSLAMIFGALIGGMLISFHPSQIRRAIGAAFSRDGETDDAMLGLDIAVFERAHQLAWAGGLLSQLVGLIVMLLNLDDPSRIGPGLAVAALPLLYGVFLAEFVIAPLRYALLARSPGGGEKLARPQRRMNRTTAGFVIASVLLLMAAFGVTVGLGGVREDPSSVVPTTRPASVPGCVEPCPDTESSH